MKKVLIGLLGVAYCIQIFFPIGVVIAETIAVETFESGEATENLKKEEIISEESGESVAEKVNLSEQQAEVIEPLATPNSVEIFSDYFSNWIKDDPIYGIGKPSYMWNDMFIKAKISTKTGIKINIPPSLAHSGTSYFSDIKFESDYREMPYAHYANPNHTVRNGNLNVLANPHLAKPTQTVTGINKTGDISVTMTLTNGEFSNSGGVGGIFFKRLKEFDKNAPSSTTFTLEKVESYIYMVDYSYAPTNGPVTNGRNFSITATEENVDIDFANFFQVKTQDPIIRTYGTEHFQNETLDWRSNNFASGTGLFGEAISSDDGNMKLVEGTVDMGTPGTYIAQINYFGYRFGFPVIVKEDKSTLNVISSQIYKGNTWNPQDNFVSATEKSGANIPYSTTRIRTSGTVDTKTPGAYTVHYNSYDASGNILRSQSVVVNVLEDKSVLNVKNSQIAVGSKWSPQDNFVSATEKNGANIPYSTTRIQTSGTVNTNVAGTYPIVYTSHEANGELIRTETANITVVPAVVQVNHIDITTGDTFGSSEITGVVGGSFQAVSEKNDNYKYRYAKVNGTDTEEQEISGIFAEEKQTVDFYYNSRGGNITVMHVEKGTNKTLAENRILAGYVGDSYSIELTDPQHRINGYDYSDINGSLTGTFNENGQLITLYYTRELPKIHTIDFSFGELNKMTTLAYAEKTQDEMTITLPKVLENETESSWRLSAMLEQPFKAGNHEITSQLSLSDLHFSGSSGAQILTGNNWQLETGVAVPLAELSNSKQEEREWFIRFGEENQNKMSGVALRLSATEAKDNTEYSSTVRWTLTNEP